MFEGRKDLSVYGRGARARGAALSRDAAIKVGCVIAGTQKGGTTALASYLYDHPEVSIPGKKEVHYFDTEKAFAPPGPDYAQYHAPYAPAPGEHLLCDATPIYMYWLPAPARIARYNPAMKWIVVLRNPITRAYSHWNMQRIKERDPLPFLAALKAEPERCRAVAPLQHPWYSYVDRGRYMIQMRRIWEHFPREQTLALKSEDLKERPAQALERVAAFLGIAAFPAVEPRDVYAIPYADAIPADAFAYLRETFAPEVRELERELGWDCADWLAP